MPDIDEDQQKQDELSGLQDESLDTDDVSPEDRRRQYNQQEGREIDSLPLPSDDGDDADDENDREP